MVQGAKDVEIDFNRRILMFVEELTRQLIQYYNSPSYGNRVTISIINQVNIQINMVIKNSSDRMIANVFFNRYDKLKSSIPVNMDVSFQERKRVLTNNVPNLDLLPPVRGQRDEDRFRSIKSWILDAVYKAVHDPDSFFGK